MSSSATESRLGLALVIAVCVRMVSVWVWCMCLCWYLSLCGVCEGVGVRVFVNCLHREDGQCSPYSAAL